MKHVALLLLAIASGTHAFYPVHDPIPQKSGRDEAAYEIIQVTPYFEKRQYTSAMWMCMKYTGEWSEAVATSLFTVMREYLQGANSHDKVMEIHVPVSIKVPKPHAPQEWLMCIYPGHEYQHKRMPSPNREDIYFIRRPPMTVYTRRFGGYMNTGKWWEKTFDLIAHVGCDYDMRHTQIYWNTYNPPYQEDNRRNEVWLLTA